MCAWKPNDELKFFNMGDICKLVGKFYRHDFVEIEKKKLRIQCTIMSMRYQITRILRNHQLYLSIAMACGNDKMHIL